VVAVRSSCQVPVSTATVMIPHSGGPNLDDITLSDTSNLDNGYT
jgi:hypothetical protein